MKYVVFVMFAAMVPAANWMIGNIGTVCLDDGPCLIPVGFGLMAPSGVLLIGLALVLRDWLHELAGPMASVAAVLAGAALSLLFSPPALAIASAAAFLVAELADLAVYTPMRKRGAWIAVAASSAVGAFVDSVLFTAIAFGSAEFSEGLFLGKIYAGVAVSMMLLGRATAMKVVEK